MSPVTQERDPVDGPDRRKLVQRGLIALVIALAAYTVLLSSGDFEASVRALRDLDPLAVSAAVVVEVAAMLCIGAIYRATSRAVSSPLPFGAALNTSMSTFAVTQVVPAGGAIAAGLAVRRMIGWGMSAASAAIASALASTIPLMALALLAGSGVAALSVGGQLDSPWYLVAVTVLFVVLVGAVVAILRLVRSPEAGGRLIDRAERALSRWDVDLTSWRGSLADLSAQPPTPRSLLAIFAWALARWSLETLVLWLIFAGLGAQLPVQTIVVGMSVQHLAVMIPVTPGGLGLVEAGMSGAFVALGTPAAVAIPAVLVFRVVSYWMPLLAGVPQYLRTPVRA